MGGGDGNRQIGGGREDVVWKAETWGDGCVFAHQNIAYREAGRRHVEGQFGAAISEPRRLDYVDVGLSETHGLKVHALRVLVIDNTNGAAENPPRSRVGTAHLDLRRTDTGPERGSAYKPTAIVIHR